jgi:hypothetical protein
MSETDKEHAKWLVLSLLILILIGTITAQVGSGCSEGTLQEHTIAPNFIAGTPRIDAIAISGSGESCISVEGKLAHEGNIINGFTILKIYPNRVEFEKNGTIVASTFPDTQTPPRPDYGTVLPKSIGSEQVGYKGSYYNQYRQPTYKNPAIAENSSYYGQISEATGRPKTVYVTGYYRKDGTYVRSHYRSR